MAQPRRVLVLRAQPQNLDQHQLHLRRRTRNPDRLLGLPLERQPRALRLDQTRRRDPRQSRPRTSHPRPDHQIRDTPLARPSESTKLTYVLEATIRGVLRFPRPPDPRAREGSASHLMEVRPQRAEPWGSPAYSGSHALNTPQWGPEFDWDLCPAASG